MRDSSSIRGSVFWPVAIIGGGLFILVFFVLAGQSQALAIGASVSFVVLAFVSLLAGAGRTEAVVDATVEPGSEVMTVDPESVLIPAPEEIANDPQPEADDEPQSDGGAP